MLNYKLKTTGLKCTWCGVHIQEKQHWAYFTQYQSVENNPNTRLVLIQ